MPSKKILLVIPEMTMGGAQRSLSKLSIALAKFHDVWLVVFSSRTSVNYPYGGTLLSLDVEGGDDFFSKGSALVSRIKRLRDLKKKLKIEICISFLEGADYVNVLSRQDEKVIISVRGSKEFDENIGRKNFGWLRHQLLIPRLYRRADYVVCVNHGIGKELERTYGINAARIVTIGNFYDRCEIESLSVEPREVDVERLYRQKVIVTTGRLAGEKGLTRLLDVFILLRQDNPSIRMVMVGDGPLFESLRHKCLSSGLSVETESIFSGDPDVLFLRGRSNVFRYLRGAMLYIMNSSSEGFPNGLAEAMVCRIPVVSSDCPYGPRELLAPEIGPEVVLSLPYRGPNGVLLPVIKTDLDVLQWKKALSELLENDGERTEMVNNAYAEISRYDEASIVARWEDIIQGKNPN